MRTKLGQLEEKVRNLGNKLRSLRTSMTSLNSELAERLVVEGNNSGIRMRVSIPKTDEMVAVIEAELERMIDAVEAELTIAEEALAAERRRLYCKCRCCYCKGGCDERRIRACCC